MSREQIVLPKDFDINKVSFGNLKTLESGGKSLYLNYAKEKFIVQTPEMVIPFGINNSNSFIKGGAEESGKPDKWSFDLSFKGLENRPLLQHFKTMLETIDEKIVETACSNAQAWLKKKDATKAIIQEFYTPTLKYGKDKDTGERLDFPPTVKVNLPFDNNKKEFTMDVFDNKKNKVNLSDIEVKGAKAAVIMQCMGVWIVSGRFGCTWRALQVRISPSATLKEFAFTHTEEDDMEIDGDESDLEDGAGTGTVKKLDAPPASLRKKERDNVVESSDGEGEEGEGDGDGHGGNNNDNMESIENSEGVNPAGKKFEDDDEDDDDFEPPVPAVKSKTATTKKR